MREEGEGVCMWRDVGKRELVYIRKTGGPQRCDGGDQLVVWEL